MERLRESWFFDRNEITRLTEEEIKNLNIKVRLTESQINLNEVVSVANELKSRLTENDQKVFNSILNKLAENGLSNSFKVWKLPIGKYGNMNGNKRIYPLQLWQNVKDKQSDTWKGFCGLCDHPVADNDPGEFKNQAVIWHDMDVPTDGGLVYGYGSFVGPYGALAQEILEHGGRVGTSSSGFGDVDTITKTVDPNTYIIERLADLVLNPSQGTFGTAKDTKTAGEFLKDPAKGASIEYNKYQPMKEAEKIKPRSKIMAEKYDAVRENQQPQPAAPSGQAPIAAPTDGAAQGASQIANENEQKADAVKTTRESLQESTRMETKGTLTKVEEKAFRKYVQSFLEDANKIDNPIKRLNECVDILSCFDEGNCPDLREALEKQLLEEKSALEKLVEEVVTTEKDYDMNITQFREAAERNTAQGLLLHEQVTDYKELCDGLAKRNIQLKEENENLKKKLNIHNKLSEKKIMLSNKEIVDKSSEVESLQETVEKLETRNERLMERVSKLALSNKEFEKENDILVGKLKEAGTIMKGVKEESTLREEENKKIDAGIIKLQERIRELEEANEEIEKNYDVQSKRYTKLQEDFNAYKQEVNDTYNPIARIQPKFEERIGKFLNFRENKGIEIESYWADLKEKYGDAIDPFEDQIRGAKTLREATSTFLSLRTQIDPNFAVAQPAEFSYRNRDERAKLYEHQGIINPLDSYRESSTDQKNEEFLKNLHAAGLQ